LFVIVNLKTFSSGEASYEKENDIFCCYVGGVGIGNGRAPKHLRRRPSP
jgi:hypothetical protein